jgi:hypothetical protein
MPWDWSQQKETPRNGSRARRSDLEQAVHSWHIFIPTMTAHKAQGRTIDKVVLDLHYKSNHRKQLGFDEIFVPLSRVRCCSSIRLIIKHTHTHTSCKKPMDTFQDPSQLLMWWPFAEVLQAMHRRDKFGTCNPGTWFNQLIPSTLLYFIRSTNTLSIFPNF